MTTLRNDSAAPASQEQFGGLTKRECIAMQIMAGLVSLPTTHRSDEEMATKSVRIMADALIRALNKEESDDGQAGS